MQLHICGVFAQPREIRLYSPEITCIHMFHAILLHKKRQHRNYCLAIAEVLKEHPMAQDGSRGRHAKPSTPDSTDSTIQDLPTGYVHFSDSGLDNQQFSNQVNRTEQPVGNEPVLNTGQMRHINQAPISYTPTSQQDYIPHGEARKYNRSHYGKKRKHKGRAKFVVLGVLAALLILAGYLGLTAKFTLDEINVVRGEAKNFAQYLAQGDNTKAVASAEVISNSASKMNGLMGGPIWFLASKVPGVGNDIAVARSYCSIFDKLSGSLIVPLANNLSQANAGPILRNDGSFNADAIKTVFESIAASDQAIQESNREAAHLQKPTIKQLASAHNVAGRALLALSQVANASHALAPEVHYLLGADGSPRAYTIMALNNAECHSAGGLVGSFGTMYVENGKLSIGEFDSYSAIGNYADGYESETGGGPEQTDEEVNLFGRMNVFSPCDVTNNPDFPRGGEQFLWMCQDKGFDGLDGAITIDPTVLQALLAANNLSTTLDNGYTLTGKNTVKYLLHDVYTIYKTNSEQDEVFSNAASAAFKTIFDKPENLDLVATAQAVWAARHRNMQTWFPNANLQFAFNELGYSGEVSHNPAEPVLGVYINDQTWSKISWYLDAKTKIGKPQTNADGSTSYQVTTTLTNTLNEEEMKGIPNYVWGFNKRKRAHDDMLNCIYLFAPEGGTITSVKAEGDFVDPSTLNHTHYYPNIQVSSMQEGTYEGLNVWYGYTCMRMGDSIKLTYTVTTSPQATAPLTLDTTPSLTKYRKAAGA